MKFLYIFQRGDCLTKVAEKFKVSVDAIAKLNGITNVDTINAGDCIEIPSNGDVDK